MTNSRYDAVAVREYTDRNGDKKSSFTRIGVAFPMRDKDGYSIQLEAIPAPTDGTYRILLMPPKPRDGDAAPARREAPKAALQSMDVLEDEIPF